jgi:hypothetical protein
VAILWCVAPVIVLSIKCLACRPCPHVGKEILEAVPAGTDLNTASAVFGIVLILRIMTAALHAHPGDVCRRPLAVGVVSMLCHG